ncbi:hypothetical protein ACWCP6_01055 [Streptomyces sp. NPDC002004]
MTGEQDMAHHDIAVRLAEAADEVEVGIAPYQAVLRGGRRRRARRWALGAVGAVLITGAAGSLALTAADGHQRSQVTTDRRSVQERHVYIPQRTTITEVYDEETGTNAEVSVEVWGAPQDAAEAREQQRRMTGYGVWDERSGEPEPARGRSWFAVVAIAADGRMGVPVWGFQDKTGAADGLGFEGYGIKVGGTDLTVGHVGPRVKRVVFEYQDGTREPELAKVAGADERWFAEDDNRKGFTGKLRRIRVYDAEEKGVTVRAH